jgi:gluconate 2-dehydrogenase gamma chain
VVEAAIARLIPADELGPGARKPVSRSSSTLNSRGAWGSGDNLYRQGPFVAGTPQQVTARLWSDGTFWLIPARSS